jgi:hypothetical protein
VGLKVVVMLPPEAVVAVRVNVPGLIPKNVVSSTVPFGATVTKVVASGL